MLQICYGAFWAVLEAESPLSVSGLRETLPEESPSNFLSTSCDWKEVGRHQSPSYEVKVHVIVSLAVCVDDLTMAI